MSHADPIAPLYDHEREDTALGGGRRRAAHDWGADDLFDGTRAPRRGRRFERADDDRSLAAGDRRFERADDDRFEPGPFEDDARSFTDQGRREGRAVPDWFAEDDARRVDDWLADGRSAQVALAAAGDDDRLGADFDDADLPSPSAPTLELDLPLGETRPARRTVTITGNPDAVRRAERSGEIARRRPAPSLDARIGHRPDQVAMWACALGLLLVIVAIATANV